MNENELHAVSLLLRGASKTLIVIDDNNPATAFLAECFVSLITSSHNTPITTKNPISHSIISYTPTPTHPTNFITTLKNAGNIIASQKDDTITLNSTEKPEISSQFPFDCLIILSTKPFSTSPFLLQNPHLTSSIPTIVISQKPTSNHSATYTISSETHSTLAQVVLTFLTTSGITITETMATALLACLYTETEFLTQPLSPKTLTTASKLLEYGAEHEKIMSALLRNKSHQDVIQLGTLFSSLISNEKTGITYTPKSFPFSIAKTAAHEIFTSLRNIHICIIPETIEKITTYHIWTDTSINLSTLLPICEGEITKHYAKIKISEDLETLIIYLQHSIESL